MRRTRGFAVTPPVLTSPFLGGRDREIVEVTELLRSVTTTSDAMNNEKEAIELPKVVVEAVSSRYQNE